VSEPCNSPDLSQFAYGVCGVMQQRVYRTLFVNVILNMLSAFVIVIVCSARQIYIHNVSCASRKVRVLRPFVALGFAMMSLLCCLSRYGLYYNHWTDVVVGALVGVVLAVYIVSPSTTLLRLTYNG